MTPTPGARTPEEWARLKRLFHQALELPPAERERWLQEAAPTDALLADALALLAAHDTAAGFLEQPATIDPRDLEAGDELQPGSQVGVYTIVEEIGRGGMGVVYLGEDTRLGRRVALKCLPEALAADPGYRERLRREARAAATITHPNVAVVYALEEIDGRLLIVSEYVSGRTLRAALAAETFDDRRAMRVMSDVARALVAAHEAGVVHRDLKPENVLLTDAGGVKVVDFGIAQVQDGGPRLTLDGAAIGTPAYMAPEQLAGAPADARVDIYAAGVVLREMLRGPTTRLASVVERCLREEPTQRFQSARELLAALETSLTTGHEPVAAPAAGSARWWWGFHQGMAALLYWAMVIPAWIARGLIGGALGRFVFIAVLASVIVAANLRLHLWFTSRFYPGELKWLRGRVARWIRAADWLFVVALLSAALLLDERTSLAVLLLSFAVGAAVAFLFIEPATTRAAFRRT